MTTLKPLVLGGLLFALTTAAVSLLGGMRPGLGAASDSRQRPRSLLVIASEAPRVLFTTSTNTSDYSRYLETQIGLIKSRLVLNKALQQPEVSQLPAIKNQRDPLDWLSRGLEVARITNSELLEVTLDQHSGASAPDQAAIINAVVDAYTAEVVNANAKRALDRHEKLKMLSKHYTECIKQRRETMRSLSESVGKSDGAIVGDEKSLARRAEKLKDQRLKLRLQRAEVETILARRKKATQTDAIRSEVAHLEDRLAVVTAQEAVLRDELEQLAREQHTFTVNRLDLTEMKDEVAALEDASRKIGAEVEKLNIELLAPPRIRVLERAVAPKG
jgi:hypothetical protein